MVWFDESRLDDEYALGSADLRLRTLAESGSRVRQEAGNAAEFSTMVPHAFGAHGGPAEILCILDHEGERSHLSPEH